MSLSLNLKWNRPAFWGNKGLDRAVANAVSKAGGDAARAMRTDASRYVRQRKALKAKTVNDAMVIRFPFSKNLEDLAWTMRVSGRPIPMAEYPYRQGRRGVSVTINKGKRVLVKGAFASIMRSGHEGIFRRKGKARLPIHELFSSRVVDPFKDSGMIDATFSRTSIVFAKSYARLLPLELARLK